MPVRVDSSLKELLITILDRTSTVLHSMIDKPDSMSKRGAFDARSFAPGVSHISATFA